MLFLLILGAVRVVRVRQIHQFRQFSGFGRGADRCGGDRLAKGEKKPPGSPAVFFGNFGCALRAINPLDPPAV
ncbi:hypothetical protein NUV26_10980 [Burkholderia pseudomultivorans]|uniref:hypothetical protein n=1 Tax=Burkholderia pseudomultivorans TaxID=1207504 RepID=UPI0028748CAA|nr:hypothetical protein [Burkholderia pseudomultivorans]MDS0792679.1 hypothetical protein [Burkholderia pseudomultivorans]